MTLREFAHIALRIGAVIILIDILTSLPMAFTAARYYAPATFSQEVIETAFLPFAASLVIAVLIYSFAEEIADCVVLRGKTELQTSAPADIAALERPAVAVLGLYFLVMGLADGAHILVRYFALKQAIGTATSAILVSNDTADLGEALFRITIGAFLVLNGDAFIRLRNRLRAKRGIAGEEKSVPKA
jgi:hypothetical protein